MNETFSNLIEGFRNAASVITPSGIDPINFTITFFLIYAITFAVMEKIHFLGTGKRMLRMIIGIVMAYFTATSTTATLLISTLFPYVGIIVFGILAFLVVMALIMPEKVKGKGLGIVGGIGAIATIGIMLFLSWNSIYDTLKQAGIVPVKIPIDWQWIFLIVFFAIIFIVPPLVMAEPGEKSFIERIMGK